MKKFTDIASNQTIILFLLLAAGLAVRLLLLPVRWINPDEGAHLMDARLLIEGLMPIVDYGSRQPFYVFLIAVMLKLFGVSLTAGRLLPLFSSLGVGLLLYFIGKLIFNKSTGLIAAGIYLLLPLVVIWSPIVKTEQPAILLASMSVYFLLLYTHMDPKKRTWLLVSGIAAGFAFYVRQPTLYLPLAVISYLIFFERETIKERLFLAVHFLLGYLAVVAGFFAIFFGKMSLQQILFSQLNPLNLILNRLLHTLNLLPQKYRVVDENSFRILDQTSDYTLTAWNHAFFLSLIVIAGAILYIASGADHTPRIKRSNAVILNWLGFVLALYLFQTANRGFYSQYFTEALPPLVLMAAFYLNSFFRKMNYTGQQGLLLVAAFAIVLLAHKIAWRFYPGEPILFVLSTVVLLLLLTVLLSRRSWFRHLGSVLLIVLAQAVIFLVSSAINIPNFFSVPAAAVLSFYLAATLFKKMSDSYLEYAQVFILLISLYLTAAFSGRHLGPSYEAVWAQGTLKEIRTFLQKESQATDTVLSGGMIWAFESELEPYQIISHPTEFLKKRQSDFEKQFVENRPTFVILDKYTAKKFSRYWEFLSAEIERNYKLVHTVPNGSFSIKIFRNVAAPAELMPAFAQKSCSAL